MKNNDVNKVTLFLFLLFSVSLRGVAEPNPYTFVVSSSGSNHFFLMQKDGGGKCYVCDDSGVIKPIWEIDKIYEFPRDLQLSRCGSYLVIAKMFVNHLGKSKEDVKLNTVLEIYKKGSLVKKLILEDLKVDPDKLTPIISSPGEIILFADAPKINVGNLDGASYRFNDENLKKIEDMFHEKKGALNLLLFEIPRHSQNAIDLDTGNIILSQQILLEEKVFGDDE
jgi:hypothetical protein